MGLAILYLSHSSNTGMRAEVLGKYRYNKVLTQIEYRAMSSVFQTFDPPSPLRPASVSSNGGGGGVHTGRAVGGGGGGSIIWKTPDIDLASYSIIPLRPVQTKTCFSFIQCTVLYFQSFFYSVDTEHKE
jgi:hypothetical protein